MRTATGIWTFILSIVLAAAPAPGSNSSGDDAPVIEVSADALDATLARVGLARDDLGWTPRPWWPRWPDVPYKLRSFDALFAAPLENVNYLRTLAAMARDRLAPTALNKAQPRGATSLYQAVQALGVDPLFGGFRGYTANCLASELPLNEAILALRAAGNHPVRINTFGMDLPYPRPVETLAEKVKVLPEGVSPILGRLVGDLVTANRWAELAFRRVDPAARAAVATRYDVGMEMIDAYDYIPEIDDVAADIDWASLWYAGQQCVQALDQTRLALKKLDLTGVPPFAFDYRTHFGWIRVRGGGDDLVDGTDALLIVDLGGNDRYTGGVAASNATRPLGLLLDLSGDDTYEAEGPAQGAGLCGAGVLIDDAGDDVYRTACYGQGVGQFGLGLLADLGGDDVYFTKESGQGCGYFGSGMLFDAAGDDVYRIHADGQGLGGVGGTGILADHGGDDAYTAVREHSVTGRPSYHSPGLDVCVSNAQGCGMGRRGDGADGHSWAGGLGALLDASGDDVYRSGNWTMGSGYWFGIGYLHDGGGNDAYHGVAYTQATGAHFCIGVLVDESGDDAHLAEENSYQSVAWAHDFTVAILLDGEGNDTYRVDKRGLGRSINRSVALLLDLAGNDAYKTRDIARPGMAENGASFRSRPGVSTYFAETTSLGLFLDADGTDSYWGELRDGGIWLDPADSPNWKDRNFGIGVDLDGGKVDFTLNPVKAPSR